MALTMFELVGLALLWGLIAIVLSAIALVHRGPRGKRGRRGPHRKMRRPSRCGAHDSVDPPTLMQYYLKIADFAQSFVEAATASLPGSVLTIASSFLAGRAPIYNSVNNLPAGTCSASFLNIQTADGVFTDISNYIATTDGLIVTWFTPTTLVNLALDSVIHGMVTECIVTVTTKVGASLFFGKTYDLVVSSDGQNIIFRFNPLPSSSP